MLEIYPEWLLICGFVYAPFVMVADHDKRGVKSYALF